MGCYEDKNSRNSLPRNPLLKISRDSLSLRLVSKLFHNDKVLCPVVVLKRGTFKSFESHDHFSPLALKKVRKGKLELVQSCI